MVGLLDLELLVAADFVRSQLGTMGPWTWHRAPEQQVKVTGFLSVRSVSHRASGPKSDQ